MEALRGYTGLEQDKRILYTPTPFAKKNLIYLQETGELCANREHISQRDYLRSYLFMLVMDGTGRVLYKGKQYTVRAGDCVFIDCTNEYSHTPLDERWLLKWVHFSGGNVREIYENYVHNGGKPCFQTKRYLVFADLLTEIYGLAQEESGFGDMMLYQKLVSLLVMLTQEGRTPEEGMDFERSIRDMTPIKQFLDENYRDKISLDQIAETFYVNKFYMTRIFKKQYGISIVSYLTQVRITHAKQLLRFTDMPIENVSQECGLSDANYFSRVFRKVEGTSPGEFRKMWQGT